MSGKFNDLGDNPRESLSASFSERVNPDVCVYTTFNETGHGHSALTMSGKFDDFGDNTRESRVTV